MKLDKLNGCIDPDSLNKAVDLLFGLALGNNAKKFCEIILNLGKWFRRRWQPSYLVEQKHLANFGREHHGGHSREVIRDLDQCSGDVV